MQSSYNPKLLNTRPSTPDPRAECLQKQEQQRSETIMRQATGKIPELPIAGCPKAPRGSMVSTPEELVSGVPFEGDGVTVTFRNK